MLCRGITLKGEPCRLVGSPKYGGQWCHHHCSGYFSIQRHQMESKLNQQSNEMTSLQERLHELAKRASPMEADYLNKQLVVATSSVNAAMKEMTSLFNQEISALKDVIKEESEVTRDAIKDSEVKLQTGQVGIAQMIQCVYSSIDNLVEGPQQSYDSYVKLLTGTSGYQQSDLGEIRTIFSAIRDQDMTSLTPGNIDHFFTAIIEKGKFKLALADTADLEHENAVSILDDAAGYLKQRLRENGRIDLIPLVNQACMQLIPKRYAKKRRIDQIGFVEPQLINKPQITY